MLHREGEPVAKENIDANILWCKRKKHAIFHKLYHVIKKCCSEFVLRIVRFKKKSIFQAVRFFKYYFLSKLNGKYLIIEQWLYETYSYLTKYWCFGKCCNPIMISCVKGDILQNYIADNVKSILIHLSILNAGCLLMVEYPLNNMLAFLN